MAGTRSSSVGAAFGLVGEASGDRGLGPVLEAHPELVSEVAVEGANPDIDTPADLARAIEASWGARVRANREQVERLREVPDGTDFYAPVSSLFRADPTRTDDPVLDALLALVRSGETWLDVGAGAGRFALPIARALDPSGGSVVALDPSRSMLEGLLEIAEDYAVENVRTIEARWPLADARAVADFEADVALIAHVGYDVEEIGPFVDGMEAAAGRLCVAVLMEQVPAAAANPFWPPVHGEERVPLPALPDLLELLEARGRRAVGRADRDRAAPVRVARGPRGLRPAPALDRPGRAEGEALPEGTRRADRAVGGRLDARGAGRRHGRDRDVGAAVTARRADEDAIPPEAFLSSYPDEIRALAEQLRAVVRRAAPDAIERVRLGWRLIGYDLPVGRRTVYFAWVAPEPIHVHLGWQHGTFMVDPDRMLEGAHLKLRKVRFTTFRPGDTIPEAALVELTRQAARLAAMSREERLALTLDRDWEPVDEARQVPRPGTGPRSSSPRRAGSSARGRRGGSRSRRPCRPRSGRC